MKPDAIFDCNPSLAGMASITEDLSFTCEGVTHPLTLITPNRDEQASACFPLVVFLQGSGWTSPDRYYQLPQLCRYAQRGLAIASITHRNAQEGHPFPAYLKDAKAAIRFLRSRADEFHLDPDRVAFFGTSSGGNTALLVGLSGDDPRYRTPDYAGHSDSVQAVVDCFGPTDMLDYEGNKLTHLLDAEGGLNLQALAQHSAGEEGGFLDTLLGLFGDNSPLEVLRAMSPVYAVKAGGTYPPFMLLQGDADDIVPLSQTLKMHEKLQSSGAQSTYVLVRGGVHEGNFWSQELHDTIFNFLNKSLRG